MSKSKATTQDVAKLAGVSTSTVSMILNSKENVSFSEETVRNVLDAARSLDYKIKAKKDGLLGTQAQLIAVFSPTLSNPYYATLIQSIESQAASLGYRLFICNTYRDPQTEKKYLDMLSQSAVSGIIYTFMPHYKEYAKQLSASIPLVIISDKNEAIDIDTVELNSMESGIILAEYLLSLGHRKFAFISTPLSDNNVPRVRRLEGIKTALKSYGKETKLIVRESDTDITADNYDVNFESEMGYEIAMEVIGKEDVTALIGVNDMVAYGILDALAEKKLHAPGDYSVCGFDNIFPSAFSGISLTTIDHSIASKGKDAIDILFRKINKKTSSTQQTSIFKVEYKPTLIVRDSTGPATR